MDQIAQMEIRMFIMQGVLAMLSQGCVARRLVAAGRRNEVVEGFGSELMLPAVLNMLEEFEADLRAGMDIDLALQAAAARPSFAAVGELSLHLTKGR